MQKVKHDGCGRYSWCCYNYIQMRRVRSQWCLLSLLLIVATENFSYHRCVASTTGSSTNLFSTRTSPWFGITTSSINNILVALDPDFEETKEKQQGDVPSSSVIKKEGQQSQKHDQIRRWIASTTIGNEEEEEEEDDENTRQYFFSTPTKLLYAICNKLRPIRTSPDYMLRIGSASEEDANIAAFAMFHLANCCSSSYSRSILADRRFEQLVECILCQLHVPKDLRANKEKTEEEEDASTTIEAELESIERLSSTEAQQKLHLKDLHHNTNNGSAATTTATASSLSMRLSHHHQQHHRGLTLLDASHAVWAFSKLLDDESLQTSSTSITAMSFAGIPPQDIVIALGLRCQEILQQQTILTIHQQRQFSRDIAFMLQAFAYAEFVFCMDPILPLLTGDLMDLACTKLLYCATSNNTSTSLMNTSITYPDHAKEVEQVAKQHVVADDDYQQRCINLLTESELTQVLWYLTIRHKKKCHFYNENITFLTKLTKKIIIDRLTEQYHQQEEKSKRKRRSYYDEEPQLIHSEDDFGCVLNYGTSTEVGPSTENGISNSRICNNTTDASIKETQTLAFEDGVCVIDYNTTTTEIAKAESIDMASDLPLGTTTAKEDEPLVGMEKTADSSSGIIAEPTSAAIKETLAFEDGICVINYNTTTDKTSTDGHITHNLEVNTSEEARKIVCEDGICVLNYKTTEGISANNGGRSSVIIEDSTVTKEGYEEEDGVEAAVLMKDSSSDESIISNESMRHKVHAALESNHEEVFSSKNVPVIPPTDLSDNPNDRVHQNLENQQLVDLRSNSTNEAVENKGVALSTDTTFEYHDNLEDVGPTTPLFSAREICSILWSLTELDGHVLSTSTMEACLGILLNTFDGSANNMASSELVNVVWSISRFIAASSTAGNSLHLSPIMIKIQRTLGLVSSLLLSNLAMGDEVSAECMTHLDCMRLIIAFESISENSLVLRKDIRNSNSSQTNASAVAELSTKALINVILLYRQKYSVTELANLTAAAISLNNYMGSELLTSSCQALGSLQIIVETALLNTSFVIEQGSEQKHTTTDGFIVPFLGKSRWIPFGVWVDDNGEFSDISTESEKMTVMKANSFGLLSAIINLSYGLCQYSGRDQIFCASGVIRFFARYISGLKNLDMLFRVLQPVDITKLLWVCAKVISPQSTSYATESRDASYIVGRKILHEFIHNKNIAGGNSCKEERNKLENFMDELDSSYRCQFLWSFAKLCGNEVHHGRYTGKELHFSRSLPLNEKTENLDLSDMSNLLWAMAHLGILAYQDLKDLEVFLTYVELKLPTGSPDDLFFLFESIIIARRFISQMTKNNNESPVAANGHGVEASDDDNLKSLWSNFSSELSPKNNISETTVVMVPDIIIHFDKIIVMTADQLLKAIPSYSCSRLRQLLQVYGSMPLVVSNFLNAMDEEVKLRLSILSKNEIEKQGVMLKVNPSFFIDQLQESLHDLGDSFSQITGTNITADIPSILAAGDHHARKRSRWSLFAAPRDESSTHVEDVSDQIDDSAVSIIDNLQSSLRRLSSVLNETLTYFAGMERANVLHHNRISSSFYELGKCQELICALKMKHEQKK